MQTPSAPSKAQEVMIGLAIVVLLTSTGVIDDWGRPPPRADDPDLVSRVAGSLLPPSTEPYNLTMPAELNWGQSQQVRVIQALTRNKTGGFFVETGAYDGELMSNTLLLEKVFGWRGVLIEPSRTLFPRLVQKHRRSWALRACCSQTGQPFQAVFRDQRKFGISTVEDGLSGQQVSENIRKSFHPNTEITKYPVECVPLYTVLLALKRTSVDFFSLDVEGVELGILVHLPWHLVDIKIVLAEFHLSHFYNPQADQMRWFMEQQGYLATKLMHDWLFVKKDSEYAEGAAEIVRNMRHQLANEKPSGDSLHRMYDPFNSY